MTLKIMTVIKNRSMYLNTDTITFDKNGTVFYTLDIAFSTWCKLSDKIRRKYRKLSDVSIVDPVDTPIEILRVDIEPGEKLYYRDVDKRKQYCIVTESWDANEYHSAGFRIKPMKNYGDLDTYEFKARELGTNIFKVVKQQY